MKLHIKKDWINKFDHKEKEVEYGAGLALGRESTLSAVEKTISAIDWSKFPIKEMAEYGWIKGKTKDLLNRPNDSLRNFFLSLGSKLPDEVLCRRTIYENSHRTMNRYALIAWSVRILTKAKQSEIKIKFDPECMSNEFLNQLVRLSRFEDGPLQVKEMLARFGIVLVIERHLPKTYLDGAAMLTEHGRPVIGLTLRLDRVDNFWFTLMHEIIHVWMHLKDENEWFIDNFEQEINSSLLNKYDKQANKYARDLLIPKSKWRRSDAYTLHTPAAVYNLANALHIHPAIVAGRIQYEFNKYEILRDIVDGSKVRKFFKDVI